MSFSLKDQIYNQAYVSDLSNALKEAYPALNKDEFQQLVINDNWQQLELKERMAHIAVCLKSAVPENYPTAVEIFKATIQQLPSHDFANLIFPDYVEKYGLEELEISLDALALFTQYGSSEFGIRPFILNYEKETMDRMLKWAEDENYHVRRLASEGCRPRLPWGVGLPKFKKDPSLILPILELLKADEEDYVYRSVANNLNDISKDNPELVLEIGERWYGKHPNTDWAVKHSLRTLLKKGNPRAMQLFGYGSPDAIEVSNLQMPTSIQIGEELPFSFSLHHQEKQAVKLRLEYAVDYLKKRGTYNRKVFKITENTYAAGQTDIQKKQWFKDFSTRKHYPGTHRVAIIVNGVEKTIGSFELKA